MNKFFPRINYQAPEAPAAGDGITQQPTLLNTPPVETPPADPNAPPADPNAPPPEKKDEPAKFDIATLELPEGFSIPDDRKEAVSELATKHGLSNEAMKDLAALQADLVKEKAQEPYKLWQTTQAQWQDTVKSDPEIGGDKLPATLQTVSKALDQYGTPGVRAALDFTGAGNNPEIVKTLHAMAKALNEGGHIKGNPPTNVPRSAAEAIYPNLPQG